MARLHAISPVELVMESTGTYGDPLRGEMEPCSRTPRRRRWGYAPANALMAFALERCADQYDALYRVVLPGT